jgi:hypothetical protein
MPVGVNNDPFQMLSVRRKEIEAEITRLNTRIDELKRELPELVTAEKVLSRLAGRSGNEAGPSDESVAPTGLGGKPEGTPTVPAMISAILTDAEKGGKHGLEPKEMTAEISKRWWPSVAGEMISPIAWRMWKRGQLKKDGPRYRLAPVPELLDWKGPA